MNSQQISRRSVLKSLSVSVAAGSVLQVIPAQAAEFAHEMVAQDKAKTGGEYAPKYFDPHQYKTLRMLCDAIIPTEQGVGGALDAGAPEFIDLLTSENTSFQLTFGGGMLWLDSACRDRYDNVFLDSSTAQQKEMLDLIAYRKNADQDASLTAGVEFFAMLRNFTADAFFTSKIGIEYLGYMGNTFLPEFPGCPPVPGV